MFLDKKFVSELQKVISILAPIDKLVSKYQSDKVQLSDVANDLWNLRATFDELEHEGQITKAELNYIDAAVKNREDFLLSPTHFLCNMLDARFFGDGLDKGQVQAAENLLCQMVGQEDLCIKELNEFVHWARQEKKANSSLSQHLQKFIKTPLQFWETDGKQWLLLQPVACNLWANLLTMFSR